MFKGENLEVERRTEEINQNSDEFIFSFADLELVERNGKRRKFRLLSDELSKKLHQIYSEGKSGYIPPIKFIDSKLDEEMESAFGVSRYKWWVKLSKEKLQKKCEIQGEVMRLNFAICCISLTN